MEPKITLPTGTEIELSKDLWKPVSYVAVLNTPDGITLVPVLVTKEDPQNPTVYGVFVLTDSASQRLVRDLDAVRQEKPSWLKQH